MKNILIETNFTPTAANAFKRPCLAPPAHNNA